MTPSPHIPQYILFSSSDRVQGTWHFSIRSPTGSVILEASDREPEAQGDRLDLLPVVLGLEALEQPSKITLSTPSRYVQEGIRFGLSEWQANGWQWEFFGEMVPVKNRDLWQRVERAMRFHQVECRFLRFDPPHRSLPGRNFTFPQGNAIVSSPSKNISGCSGSPQANHPFLYPPGSISFQSSPYCLWDPGAEEEKAKPVPPQEEISLKKVPLTLPTRIPLPNQGISGQQGQQAPPTFHKGGKNREYQESAAGSPPVGEFPPLLYGWYGAVWGPLSGGFFALGKRLWKLLHRWMTRLRPVLGNVFPI